MTDGSSFREAVVDSLRCSSEPNVGLFVATVVVDSAVTDRCRLNNPAGVDTSGE